MLARIIISLFWVTLLSTSVMAADEIVKPGKNALVRAIEMANSGDRLILEAGDYVGGFTLTKSIEIHGNGDVNIIGAETGSVIRIDVPGVVISGLHLTGSGSNHKTIDSGVQLTKKAANAIIQNNYLEGNLYGIDVHGARNALVRNNTIIGRQGRRMNRRGNGVYVWNAPGARVENNKIKYGRDGIFVNSSRKNTFTNNRFEDLRFAVHYMYADKSEVSGNVSIGNHLGYAIMFTTHVKIENNLSIGDRDHGIMLNYANKAIVKGNVIQNGGKKCLFMYNANKNILRDNHFEGCPIGIHFTAGSERNEIIGNSFIGNRIQVKYVGSRDHDWRGNFWSDHAAFDVNGDNIADQAFRPNDTMDQILWTQPTAKLLLGSPAIQLIKWAQKEFPSLLPGGVIDEQPRMKPTFNASMAAKRIQGRI
ncbi:nitrous oxide reductase family maturation protein NosD [Lentilitoribacter sp. EG35]|uniref:nitrous oxide reductase family maturation protein NosD n=1 Tax=Lentilitoribacter sp. EG35 TaxID=3234192 RepID=UPI003460ADDF